MLRVRGAVPAAVHGVAVDGGGVHELARDALPVPGGRGARRPRAGLRALRAAPGPPVGAHGRRAGAARASQVHHAVSSL